MAEKVTICLIGPTAGGKSSLLATWIECATQRVHSYAPQISFAARPIPEKEFAGSARTAEELAGPNTSEGELAESDAAGDLRILGVSDGEFDALLRNFFRPTGTTATDTNETFAYYFHIEWSADGGRGGETRTVRAQIVDAAGELAAPDITSNTERNSKVLKKFEGQITRADAIVVVLPLVDMDGMGWVTGLRRVLSNLIASPGGRLQRIAVVFSQYERLFVPFGSSAFQFAARREMVRQVIRRQLEHAEWLRELCALEGRTPRVDVRLMVTSAYGFVKGHGNANLDPHQAGQHCFRPPDASQIAQDLWRPFLTADPFLYAALGATSRYMFSFAELDGSGAGSRPVVPPPKNGPREPPDPHAGDGWAAENGPKAVREPREPAKAPIFDRLKDYFDFDRPDEDGG